MIKKYWWVLAIGVLIRVILSAISFHPDIQVFDLSAQLIRQGNVLNFYDYLYQLPQDSQILKSYPLYLFNYPPAIYFFHGLFGLIFLPFFTQEFLNNFVFNYSSTFGQLSLYFHLFFLKAPLLLFDLGSAFLLTKLFTTEKEKRNIFFLWIFNPISIYASFMMGQFDIIPTFFSILALVILKEHRFRNLQLGALSLGVGSAFKIFPLFFLIPLISFSKSWKERIVLLILGFLPYILSILPFIFSKGYRSSALVANQTLKSLYAQIPVSGGESIILFISLLVFIYSVILFSRIAISPWQSFFLPILIFFVFTHTHPQWFLWITPFFLINLVESKWRFLPLALVLFFVFIAQLFFFDPSLTIGIFSPLGHIQDNPSLWQILKISPDVNFSRSLLHSIFTGIALFCLLPYIRTLTDD